MQKIKFLTKLSLAYLTRFKGLILIGVVIGLLIFFAVNRLFPYFVSSRVERVGITGRYHTEDLPLVVTEKISSGLTKNSEDGTPVPALAESWKETENGKVWEFILDSDGVWQDGKEITSDDIHYSFKDVIIEKPDKKKIVFRLPEPYSPFPSVLSKPLFKKGLLGTGDWKVKKITFAGEFVNELLLVNNDKKRILYRFYPTTDRTKIAFKLGQVDRIVNLAEKDEILNWPNIDSEEVPDTNQVVTLFFNYGDRYVGGESEGKSLRQALLYAIDKSEFPNRAISPISPLSWAFNPQVKEYQYDIGRAKEIIKDLPEEFKKDLNLKLSVSPAQLSVAEDIARNWKEAGIETQVQVLAIVPTDFQVFLTLLEIPHDPDQYSLWHSTQSATNISKYSDLRIDKLLEDGRNVINPDERRRIYLDFQRYLLEDVPAGFLYHPVYYQVERK